METANKAQGRLSVCFFKIARVYRYDDTSAWLIPIKRAARFTRRLLELRYSLTFKAGTKLGLHKCIQHHAVIQGNTSLATSLQNCWTVQSCLRLWHCIPASTWQRVGVFKGCDRPCVMELFNMLHPEECLKVQALYVNIWCIVQNICSCTKQSNRHSLDNNGRAVYIYIWTLSQTFCNF